MFSKILLTFISLLTVFSENYMYQNGDHYQKLNKSLTKRFWNQNLVLNCRKNKYKSIDV